MNIYKTEVTRENIGDIKCTWYLKVGVNINISRLYISKIHYHFFSFKRCEKSIDINKIKWFNV